MSSLVTASVLPHSLAPYLVMMLAGFLVAIIGHIWKVRWMVALGIMLIFLATLLLPLALIATTEDPPSAPGIYPPGA